MALTDLVFPVLTALNDLVLGGLPALLGLVAWGAISGAIAMAIYWWLSPQARIAATNAEIKAMRVELKAAGDDLAETLRLSRRNLMLSLRVLGLAFGATVVSGLPVLAIILWVSATFGYASPAPGESIGLVVQPAAATLTGAALAPATAGGQRLIWPADGQEIRLGDGTGEIFAGPLSATGFGVIHKRRWWNLLLGNDLGYLDEKGAVDSISLGLADRRILGGLPDWLSTWEFPFFLSLVIVSLGLKFGFRIQ